MQKRVFCIIIDSMKELARDIPIPVEISAHHVHLCRKDIDALFGKGYQLTPLKELSQPGQFACQESVNLIGPKGKIEAVRVLGPERKQSQVEVSLTEQYKLGIKIPVRASGKIAGSPGVKLEGKAGTVDLEEGLICALRHIHMTGEDAQMLGVEDNYVLRMRIDGDRELLFGDVLVRVNPKYKLAMHIDTDEANAANLSGSGTAYIDSIQNRIGEI